MTTVSGRAKRSSVRRPKGDETELKLLRTAIWLFSERGFHGTGIRDIADAAEVAVSAMYYYSGSKEQMLVRIMERTLDALLTQGHAVTDDFEDPAERLAMLVGSHVAFHARNPRASRVTDHEFSALTGRTRQEILERRDAYEALWRSTLDDGVRDGTFSDRGPAARFALLQMATGSAHWYRPRGKLTIPELWEQFATMGLSLMGASRGGQPLTWEALELADPLDSIERSRLEIEPRAKPRGI